MQTGIEPRELRDRYNTLLAKIERFEISLEGARRKGSSKRIRSIEAKIEAARKEMVEVDGEMNLETKK
jgi:hypothetical protein